MNDNVLSQLAIDENSVTSILRAVCVLKPIREVIVRLLTADNFGSQTVEFEGISTQFQIGGAIPDMVLTGEDLLVVVEIKVSDWRGLTDNQPQAYLKWLLDQKVTHKYFVFLVPPQYTADYHQEYMKRKDLFCSANPDHNIIFVEIDWLDVRSVLDESGLTSTCIYARDFRNVMEEWYHTKPISFSMAELKELSMYNTTAANAICRLFQLVEIIASEIEKAGFKVERNFQKQWWNDGEYGMYVSLENQSVLWVGIWTDFWKTHGCPLCVGVEKGKWPQDVIEKFRDTFPDHIVFPPTRTNPYLVRCIDQHLLVEDSVRDVSEWLIGGYLHEIRKLMSATRAQCATE